MLLALQTQWLESGIATGTNLGTGAGLAPGDGSKEKQSSPWPHGKPHLVKYIFTSVFLKSSPPGPQILSTPCSVIKLNPGHMGLG